jgi:hypothetical protein
VRVAMGTPCIKRHLKADLQKQVKKSKPTPSSMSSSYESSPPPTPSSKYANNSDALVDLPCAVSKWMTAECEG